MLYYLKYTSNNNPADLDPGQERDLRRRRNQGGLYLVDCPPSYVSRSSMT